MVIFSFCTLIRQRYLSSFIKLYHLSCMCIYAFLLFFDRHSLHSILLCYSTEYITLSALGLRFAPLDILSTCWMTWATYVPCIRSITPSTLSVAVLTRDRQKAHDVTPDAYRRNDQPSHNQLVRHRGRVPFIFLSLVLIFFSPHERPYAIIFL